MKTENIGPVYPRILGEYGDDATGPLLFCVGGVHGNEPTGAQAVKEICEELAIFRPVFRGRLIGVAGNIAGMAKDCRYIDEDLNRVWTPERMENLHSISPGTSEYQDQLEMMAIIEDCLKQNPSTATFIDLHSYSARGIPFVGIQDYPRNRKLAFYLPAPIILKMDRYLHGTFLDYINQLGHGAICFEGGQHRDISTMSYQKAAVWTMLVANGNLRVEDMPNMVLFYRELAEQTNHLPAIMDMLYRHNIEDGDDFTMEPGFTNLKEVDKNQLLAKDRNGEIHCPENGWILMPLYQKQGNDGFFLVGEGPLRWNQVAQRQREQLLTMQIKIHS